MFYEQDHIVHYFFVSSLLHQLTHSFIPPIYPTGISRASTTSRHKRLKIWPEPEETPDLPGDKREAYLACDRLAKGQ